MTQEIEILVGHHAVWVNGPNGDCLGRFGRMGVDVHRSAAEQMAGLGECLDCTHAPVTAKDWHRFVRSMLLHYSVDLSHLAVPSFVPGASP